MGGHSFRVSKVLSWRAPLFLRVKCSGDSIIQSLNLINLQKLLMSLLEHKMEISFSEMSSDLTHPMQNRLSNDPLIFSVGVFK